ncbi:tyrosine-type recombinase/integrase [Thermodesulfobacteriota bacterium]
MPYKQGKKWRGVVTFRGQRYQSLMNTKKDAVTWESKMRKELKQNEKQRQHGIDLTIFFSKYLDYADRFTPKVYDEKRTLCRRILQKWGTTTPVEKVNSDMVLSYLDEQAKVRSANASNKDRKNLLALWNWGQDILDIPTNPVAKIKKRPHDRTLQYTPSTEDVLRVIAVATREEQVFLDCYLQTGARRSEIFRLTWVDDINFEKRQCRLGTRKTKDGSMEYVWFPMNDDLYESLWWWWNNRTFKKSPYVFVCDRSGSNYGKPFKVRRKFLRGLCKKAGVTPFGFHSLRRYVASVLADTHKVSAKRIQRILRHKNLSTTERYIQNINNDLKSTLDLLSEKKIPQGHTLNEKEVNHDIG